MRLLRGLSKHVWRLLPKQLVQRGRVDLNLSEPRVKEAVQVLFQHPDQAPECILWRHLHEEGAGDHPHPLAIP